MDCRRADLVRRSTAFRAGQWIAAALVLACVDGPTQPGRLGELRIRPSYATADGPTELGFAIDSARVRIARTTDAATPLVDRMVGYSSDTASLGWLLDLLDDEETMRVEVTIWDDGARLYSGEREVRVSDGAIGGDAADLPVTYVGPAIVATVNVTPTPVTLDALGATVALAADVRDRHNQVVATTLAWSSGEESIATVDPASGVVTARMNGTTTVQASAGGKQGSASVVVRQRVASVAITPSPTKLIALGAKAQLTATANDSRGNVVAGTTFSWISSNPAVATVDASSGEVTAVAGGSVTIAATGDGVEGAGKVVVNPTKNVASIVVSPASANLTAVGAVQQFSAVARDANGQVLTGVQFDWTTGDPTVATVDSVSGEAQAAGHGTTTVTATAGSVASSASLSVDLSTTVASVVVTPGAITLTAVGAVQQFTAQARDASGTPVPVATFDWASSTVEVASVDPASGLATAAAHGTTTVSASVGAVTGTASLGVNLSASVATITVSPSTSTLSAVGATQQFTAEARDASGSVVPVAAFDWTSSAPDVAVVDPSTGLVTAAGQGTTTISASAGGVSGTASGTASVGVNLTSTVASIVVSPASASLTAVGATRQFTAVARDAAGRTLPGVEFSWTTEVPDVATIDPVTGVARAAGHGTTSVTATAGTVAGSASLAVDLSATIASIVVSPSTTTLTAVGAVQQFTAEARDAGGALVPVTAFEWASSAADVAVVNATGRATSVAQGTTTISASVGTTTGIALLDVNLTPSVASIAVSPSPVTLTTVGATQQFVAQARDASGSLLPGVQFVWTTRNADVATIDPVSGVARAVGDGSTTVTATAGSVAGSASLVVDLIASIVSVAVTPGATTLTSVGAVQQFSAEARDANGAVVPVAAFLWSATVPDVATIDPATGLATAAANGTTTIVARVGTASGTATLIVNLANSIASVVVTPGATTLTSLGAVQQFTAEARDAGGAVVPVATFEWASSATEVATITTAGVATAAAQGSTTISASVGATSGTASLAVDLTPSVASIVVSPSSASLTEVGATQQFTAQARDASGRLLPGIQFAWASTAGDVATIDPATGVATAVAHGTTAIVASAAGVSGNATLSVDLAARIAVVVISPEVATLTSVGAQQQFTAEARDGSGAVVPVAQFSWSTSAPNVATIDAAGRATATGHGAATIVASAGGVDGAANLAVDLIARVATIVVTPASATLTSIGATQQFTAEARDADGAPLPGVPFTWTSWQPAIAEIDPLTGLAIARRDGTTGIGAVAGSVTGTALLIVHAP